MNYNLIVMAQSVCLVFNPVTVDNYTFFLIFYPLQNLSL